MKVTRQGTLSCKHMWYFQALANTQYCALCGRCETPDA